MKNLLGFAIVIIFFSCQKKSFQVDLPDSVNVGMSEIYLNGEHRPDYTPFNFQGIDSGEGLLSLGVGFGSTFDSQDRGFDHAFLGFGGFPTTEGRYVLSKESNVSNNFASSVFLFSQGQHESYEEYEEILLEEGYIEITNLDLQNKIVEGRFKANFKRVKKQILFPTGYPKFLEFEGVFHDTLTVL